jgi:hypothetical protein
MLLFGRLALVASLLISASAFTAAFAADSLQSDRDTGTFSPKSRQQDLAHLRDFVYPKGYSEQTIIALENGEVPADLSVAEYARVHCGESNRIVLYPCMIRYADNGAHAYYVVSQGANKRFSDLVSAASYYRDKVTETSSHFQMEVDDMNSFVDDFCAKIAAGEQARDILAARGGRPRINHPIAPPDPTAKFQFSNLFSWDGCKDCVGIIAVNQPAEAPPPSCGQLRKQGTPHIAFFVVDRTSSKGRRSLDDSISDFTRLAKNQ